MVVIERLVARPDPTSPSPGPVRPIGVLPASAGTCTPESRGVHRSHKSGVIGGIHRVLNDFWWDASLGHQQTDSSSRLPLKLLRLRLPPSELQISCSFVSHPFRIEFGLTYNYQPIRKSDSAKCSRPDVNPVSLSGRIDRHVDEVMRCL